MKVKSQSEVAQSCLTCSDPMDSSPPGSSIHGIFQARVLEWGAIAFSEIQYNPIKISAGFLTKVEILILKFIWKCTEPKRLDTVSQRTMLEDSCFLITKLPMKP